MNSSTGSFPKEFDSIGLKEIIKSLPDELSIQKIADLGCGSGRVGLTAWKYYSELLCNEPKLSLVDADRTWFDDCAIGNGENKDTFQKACRDLGLEEISNSVQFIASDILDHLRSTKEKYDLVVMRSVLQFIDNPEELLCCIERDMTLGGAFVNACLAFPSKESKRFYEELTEHILRQSFISGSFRRLHTIDEVKNMTDKYFFDVEETAHYVLRADSKYAAKRFGLSDEQSETLKEEVLPRLLKIYSAAVSDLNIVIGAGDFEMDVPYYVLRGYNRQE